MKRLSLFERLLGWFVYSGRLLPREYAVPLAWAIFFTIVASVMLCAALHAWSTP